MLPMWPKTQRGWFLFIIGGWEGATAITKRAGSLLRKNYSGTQTVVQLSIVPLVRMAIIPQYIAVGREHLFNVWRISNQNIVISEILIKERISRKWVIVKAIWIVFIVLKTFHLPGGARPQYLNNWVSPIFASSTFKDTIPALDRVLYSHGSAGNQHKKKYSFVCMFSYD